MWSTTATHNVQEGTRMLRTRNAALYPPRCTRLRRHRAIPRPIAPATSPVTNACPAKTKTLPEAPDNGISE